MFFDSLPGHTHSTITQRELPLDQIMATARGLEWRCQYKRGILRSKPLSSHHTWQTLSLLPQPSIIIKKSSQVNLVPMKDARLTALEIHFPCLQINLSSFLPAPFSPLHLQWVLALSWRKSLLETKGRLFLWDPQCCCWEVGFTDPSATAVFKKWAFVQQNVLLLVPHVPEHRSTSCKGMATCRTGVHMKSTSWHHLRESSRPKLTHEKNCLAAFSVTLPEPPNSKESQSNTRKWLKA